VEKEMRSAQHLLYVSLKYTKTCDVILNLIERWKNTIDRCIELLLNKLKKQKVIKAIPAAPKPKVELLSKVFKKEQAVKNALELYSLFRKIPSLELIREHEFRKNVSLIVINTEKVSIDMEKLKEWQGILEKFINFVRVFIS